MDVLESRGDTACGRSDDGWCWMYHPGGIQPRHILHSGFYTADLESLLLYSELEDHVLLLLVRKPMQGDARCTYCAALSARHRAFSPTIEIAKR